MTGRLPPLTWLRAFEASARHLSFTHAAEELNLTQAAISKQVRLLEAALGEALFERKPRSLVLTKAGAAYLPKVQDGFDRLSAGTREVFGNRAAGMLTVRAPVGFAVAWIAPRLPGYLAAHPDKPVRMLSSVWAEPVERERFDLDIRYGLGHWPGFRSDRLGREMLEPLASPALAATLGAARDLARQRLVHVLGYQEGWARWLAAAGAEGAVDAGSGIQVDTSLMAYEIAAQGAGVALGRRSMSAPMLAAGRLVRPFDLAVPLAEGLHLLVPEDGRVHPHAPAFRDWLLAAAGQGAAMAG